MNVFGTLRRIVALGLISVAATILSGCGGGGGGSSALDAAQIDQALAQGNFESSFATPTRGILLPPTACTIQFGTSSGATVGVASFVSGSVDAGDFATYSADVTNVVQSPGPTRLDGGFAFDMVNFTPAAPFQGTLHFAGAYGVSGNVLNVTGSLTGKNVSGADVSIPFSINYNRSLPKIDLTGSYKDGAIVVPTASGTQTDSWTGTLTAQDPLHIVASIPVKDPTSGQTVTVTFTGQNARTSFAGAFDASKLSPLLAGLTGEWYAETHDNGKTIVGAYSVVDATGAVATNPLTGSAITGVLHATKGTASTGGGASPLKPGYYDGGMITTNTGNLRVFKLDVLHNSATSGNNGAVVVVTGTSDENIGGRVDSVTVDGDGNTVVTVKDLTNTYSQLVLSGTISGSTLNFHWTGTLKAGGTETGTFDSLGRVTTVSTKDLSGVWGGTITGTSGVGHSFGATIAQTADVATITPSSPIDGTTVGTITGYVAGTSFAGHAQSGTSFVGDFDGDVDGTGSAPPLHFNGSFAVAGVANGGSSLDSGTLILTKG